MREQNSNLTELYRDRAMIQALALEIGKVCAGPLTVMEVCGTHTMRIHQYGIKNLLPPQIHLLSGPGCPVCVTDAGTISEALAMAQILGMIFTTYGDMLRVPAGDTSLQRLRDEGADVRVIVSPLDALEIACQEPKRQVIFFAVGFETTAPLTAATLCRAKSLSIENFSVLCAHKTMPNALRSLLPGSQVDALLCPGHVCAVTGPEWFRFVPEELGKAAVVAGFEPVDILDAILRLVRMNTKGMIALENAYPRVVLPQGNPVAKSMLEQVFQPCNAVWRGLGLLPDSGLALNRHFQDFDARQRFFSVIKDAPHYQDDPACHCGDVLQGKAEPIDCPLFASACTPLHPCGACMVSSEGACAAFYKYREI